MANKYRFAITVSVLFSLLILFSTISLAVLQSDSSEKPNLDCRPQLTKTKTFIAKTAEIETGLWCADNAFIRLYECLDARCNNRVDQLTATKVNSKLPTISGYRIASKYQYECYECPSDPDLELEYNSLTINEGEKMQITASCFDSNGLVSSLQFSGWMKSSVKQTSYNDSGNHSVKVTCSDQNGLSTSKELVVTVLDVNRAPTVHTIVNN